jgi:hypothetical protein
VVSIHHTRALLLSLAAFLLLALIHTWPLAAAPAHWSRTDPGDGAFNIWVLNWVAHTLPRPAQLFEANIFYPEHRTLAYSEAMLVQGVIAAPVHWLGGSPVLAYNVALISGFALTGWAFCLLVRRWTGSWSAGYVAGSLAAFNAHSLVHITHLQFQHPEFIAVILFGLDRLIVTRRLAHILTLAGGFALHALTSIYLMVFAIWMLLFAALGRIREWWRGGAAGMLARFAAAGVVGLLLISPYLIQYVRVREAMGFSRAADEAEPASWVDYLSTAARVHYQPWSKPFLDAATSATFPGVVALVLVLLAWSDRRNTADPRFRMCAIAALGCIAVSLAPHLPIYPSLHASVPLFQAVRQIAAIGMVVLLLIAVLAGFGVASLQRTLAGRRWSPMVAAGIVVAVNLEAARAPIGFVWFDDVPEVYDVLKTEPPGSVVELPFPMPQQWFLNTPYMVNSTRHWRPLLNGYSGFRPASYYETYDLIRRFPADDALVELSSKGVSHVVVHQRAMNQGAPDDRHNPFEQVLSLQLVARDEDVLIYRLRR